MICFDHLAVQRYDNYYIVMLFTTLIRVTLFSPFLLIFVILRKEGMVKGGWERKGEGKEMGKERGGKGV